MNEDRTLTVFVLAACATLAIAAVSAAASRAIVGSEAIRAGLVQDDRGHWVAPEGTR